MIEDLVNDVSALRFGAHAILHKYGLDLAREGNVVGEVFTDKLIDQALALARYLHMINKNAPKLLVDAASAYFGTDRPTGWNEGR